MFHRVVHHWHNHKRHALAVGAVVALALHYISPDLEPHAYAVLGVLCAECL